MVLSRIDMKVPIVVTQRINQRRSKPPLFRDNSDAKLTISGRKGSALGVAFTRFSEDGTFATFWEAVSRSTG
jgi:hypothetical protein